MTTKTPSKYFIEVRPTHSSDSSGAYVVTGYAVIENYVNVGDENFSRTLARYGADQYQDALEFGTKCATGKGCDLVRPGY